MKGIALLFLLLASTQALELAKVPDHALNKLRNLQKFNPKAVQPDAHIFNGDVAFHGQFPWQALIVTDHAYLCNGVLVDDQYVLTIADCAAGYKYISITLGAQNRVDLYEPWKITVLPSRVIVNEAASGIDNNIAILKIDSIAFNNYIQAVPVSSQRDSDNFFEGYVGTVSGWGFVDDSEYFSDELRFGTVEVVSNSRCNDVYASEVTIGDGQLCAAPLSGGPCLGDGGAPLVVNNNGKNVMAGLVIHKDTCSKNNLAIYVRMGSQIEWLMANGVPVDYS